MLQTPIDIRNAFLEAELKELSAIEECEVIEGEVPIPPGIKPVGCRYVYTYKDPVSQEGEDNTERIAKARLTMTDFKKGGANLREW